MDRVPMDISVPIAHLNEAVQGLADNGFTEEEMRSECENAIDNVMEDEEPPSNMPPKGEPITW